MQAIAFESKQLSYPNISDYAHSNSESSDESQKTDQPSFTQTQLPQLDLMVSEVQTFSDYHREDHIKDFDGESLGGFKYEPERNNLLRRASSANLDSQPVTSSQVLHMQALERFYCHIHSFYLLPNGVFENQSKLSRDPNHYVPENKFNVGTQPAKDRTFIKLYDKTVSDHHANIIYKDRYRPYFTLMLCQQTLFGKASLFCRFPAEVHRLILKFIGEDVSFFIQDNGSRVGTFERISPSKPITLCSNQEMQLSMDTTIKILQAETKRGDMSLKPNRKDSNMLKKFLKDGDVKFIGLDDKYLEVLACELISFRKNSHYETRRLDWSHELGFSIPFLKLEVHEHKDNIISKYLLFPVEAPFSYSIGRNDCSDIFLSSPTCSRRHCRIIYSKERRTWQMLDGADGTPSLGGTWRSLQTIQEKHEKRPSKEFPIYDGSKFKLGENVYEFSYTRKKVKLESHAAEIGHR